MFQKLLAISSYVLIISGTNNVEHTTLKKDNKVKLQIKFVYQPHQYCALCLNILDPTSPILKIMATPITLFVDMQTIFLK